MPDLDQALARIDDWPVPHVGAGVLGPDGSRATHGLAVRRFRLASISKPLTAWACLVAVEEGTVALDDPVGPPGATVRHCLAHAAGYGFDSTGPITGVARRRIYSNTGIEVAAAHVEARTGLPFATYVAEAVFEPLGMTDTRLDGSPAHGVWSTVVDLLLFADEVLRPRLIASATRDEAISVQYPDLAGLVPGIGSFAPNPWGLGFEIHGTKSPHWMGAMNSAETVGHFGGSGTMLWIDPRYDVATVALTDRDFDEWSEIAVHAWSSFSDDVITALHLAT